LTCILHTPLWLAYLKTSLLQLTAQSLGSTDLAGKK
jgi:hypothetical protein